MKLAYRGRVSSVLQDDAFFLRDVETPEMRVRRLKCAPSDATIQV
jgi:hypothetical protein